MLPLETRLKQEAQALGFASCGIARADAAPHTAERLNQWLADGAHGDMLWMEERSQQRGSPAALWPQVRTVIMLGMSYKPSDDPLALADEPQVGRISAYARGQDYHDVVKRALKALARWLVAEGGGDLKVFVDTAPVMEKPLAHAAGLGWQGKHTNLVSRSDGSWLLLGAIMTTLDLVPDAPARDTCGSCDACQRACPTDAFPAPYRLDARRCIAYLTIELKGPIPREFRTAIGNRLYGCDDCLAVCPWNKFAATTAAHHAFVARAELAAPEIADILQLDDAAFRQIFSGSPIKRIGRNRMIRNALIVAANGDGRELPHVLPHLDDPDPIVRGAAIWALSRLDPVRFTAERTLRLPSETDKTVQEEWTPSLNPLPPGEGGAHSPLRMGG